VRVPSVPEQFTVVVPIGNDVPDGGVQVVVIGGVPPVAVGGEYVTGAVDVVTLPTLMSAGHVSVISVTGGGVGPVAFSQPTQSKSAAAPAVPRILDVTVAELS
jgi:hypothetical protein